MSESSAVVGAETPNEQVPLLVSDQSRESESRQQEEQRGEREENGGDGDGSELEKELRSLEAFLCLLGFRQFSFAAFVLSWLTFLIIGVVLPVTVLELADFRGCEEYRCETFELNIVASQACLAAMSLTCISHNLRKRGMRNFLFVDRDKGHIPRLKDLYVKQIKGSGKVFLLWSLPCLILKTSLEIFRALFITQEPWWLSISIVLALILSWTFVSLITLSASVMFHLVCNLQVIHFDDYSKLVENGYDVYILINKHIHLRHHLSKISHRFRIFLVLQSLFVTASQVVTLFQTTGFRGISTYIDGGNFAIYLMGIGVIQMALGALQSLNLDVAGIIISLHAATRISHKAQATASFASTWHALVTCTPPDPSYTRVSNSTMNIEDATTNSLLRASYSESDLESVDYAMTPTSTQLASCMIPYQRRQAYVTYMQMNPGGITIYGWTVDRVFLNTIFCIELTLLTFVLGKTVVFGS